MRLSERFRYPTMVGWLTLALLSSAVADESAPAQSSSPASVLKPVTLRIRRFEIPFSVDAVGQRPEEVQLFVSRDAGVQWSKFASKLPTAKTFLFETDVDGEFWFATRTVDSQGNAYPEGEIKPLLHVRVDTAEPELEMVAELGEDSAILVTVACADQWPDRRQVRLEHMTDIGGSWVTVADFSSSLEVRDEQHLKGAVQFKPLGEWHTVSLRAVAKDLAGNQTIVTHQLQRPRLAATTGQFASSPLARGPLQPAVPQLAVPKTNPYAVQAMELINPPPGRLPFVPPVNPGAAGLVATPIGSGATVSTEALPPASMSAALEQLPAPVADQADSQSLELTSPTVNTTPPVRPSTPAQAMRPLAPEEIGRPDPESVQATAKPSVSGDTPLPASIPSAPPMPLDPSVNALIRHSSSRKFSLEYEVESAGRSGVEEVELWGTVDRGQTWKRWGADPDRQSPFDIETNNDGLYGFCIVVVAKNGLATPRPLAESTPDIFVVVDTLKPVVRITGATYGDGDQTGALVIRYECQDENLSARPIALAFSDSAQGPWTTIAAGLENRGGHVWPADPQLPRQIYLRIDATDLAGNNSSSVLETPIDVQGLAPRARIRGFSPISGGAVIPENIPQTATVPTATFK